MPISFSPAGADTLSLQFSLRDEQGLEVADARVEDFPARGHMADFLDEIFADYFAQGGDTDNFTGTVVVQVEGGEVAATALELGPNPGEFASLPVTELR